MPVTITRKVKPILWGMNMLPHEEFRLNGCLTIGTQQFLVEYYQDMIDFKEGIDEYTVDGYESQIDEIAGNMPAEDVLTYIQKLARELLKNVKGSNKDKTEELCNEIDSLAESLRQESEHAMEQIKCMREGIKIVQDLKKTLDI